MNRLTKQEILDITENKYFLLPRTIGKEKSSKIINELLFYKNIEEELGIELPIILKVLKNGIYFSYRKKIIYIKNYELILSIDSENGRAFFVKKGRWAFDSKDYGKTWALTKEELE